MTEKLSNEQIEKIRKNIGLVREKIAAAAIRSGREPEEITLVAVTKTHPAEAVNAAIEAGVKTIGENRVQELLQKMPEVKSGAVFHLIGHLQSNKVRQIIDKVDMIQSLDSLHLAEEIDRQAKKSGKVMDVLMEVNIGAELSKSGVPKEKALEFADLISRFENIRLRGFMAIPPICEDREQLRSYFCQMRKLFIDIKAKKSDNKNIDILSMGMSSDFETAVEEGANMVRVGSAIFGKRDYGTPPRI